MSTNQAPLHADQVQMNEIMWPSNITPNINDQINEQQEDQTRLLNRPKTEAPGPDRKISPEVQKDIDHLDDINQKQEERIHKVEARVLQLINLYFVFQGVILSSISAPSPVKCHNWYVPFILSFIAALFNVVSLSGTLNKFFKYREELDQNQEDISVMKRLRVTRAEVNEIEPGGQKEFKGQDGRKTFTIKREKPDLYKQMKRRVFSYAGIVCVVIFSGVILYGCNALLCNSG